ncbi:MAG: hypothetical protein AB7I13_09545 [Vicinamibacterales bacterium]
MSSTREDGPRPRIVTGEDIGFRIDGIDPRTGVPTGTLVIRVNGEWMVPGTMPSVRPNR